MKRFTIPALGLLALLACESTPTGLAPDALEPAFTVESGPQTMITQVTALNNLTHAVGNANGVMVRWTPPTPETPEELLFYEKPAGMNGGGVLDINDADIAVGWATFSGQRRLMVWGPGGGIVEASFPGTYTDNMHVYGITNDGRVLVDWSDYAVSEYYVGFWQAGTFTPVTLPGTPTAVSRAGHIGGTTDDGRAFVDGSVMPRPGNTVGLTGAVTDITRGGTALVIFSAPNQPKRAFRWNPATGEVMPFSPNVVPLGMDDQGNVIYNAYSLPWLPPQCTVLYASGGTESLGDATLCGKSARVLNDIGQAVIWAGLNANLPKRLVEFTLEVAGATPVGDNVEVLEIADVSGVITPVTATFDQVTAPGVTQATGINPANQPETGSFQFGSPPVAYNVSTTAQWTGTIELCFDYSQTVFPENYNLNRVKLYHGEVHSSGMKWIDVTTSNDTEARVVCGRVDNLSPFLVAGPLDLASAPELQLMNDQTVTHQHPELAGVYPSVNPQPFKFQGQMHDPDSQAPWDWAIDWGHDGWSHGPATSSGQFTSEGPFAVQHFFPPTTGTYTVAASVTDEGGLSSTGYVTVTVTNVAPVVGTQHNCPGPYYEGGDVCLNAGPTQDMDDDVGTLRFDWDFDASDGVGVDVFGTPLIGPNHVYAQDGSYTATVTATDHLGLSHTGTLTFDVLNVAPTVHGLPEPGAEVEAGFPWGVTAHFTDPGILDAPWAWTIDWGDGTTTSGSAGEMTAAISGAHTYSALGEQTVTVCVTDEDGEGDQGCASTTVDVVDTTPPTVEFTGNAGTYSLADMVDITCTSADIGSGVESDTCEDFYGLAWTFGSGVDFTATAIDFAGNVGSGSFSFTVEVTHDGLCALVRELVSHRGTANSLCVKLNASAKAKNVGSHNGPLEAFINEVEAQAGKKIDAAHAPILIDFAMSLML